MKSLSTKLRLASKDYSEPGWYFVTLGADFHRNLFGRMNGTKVELNAWGRIVAQAWRGIGGHYGSVEIHAAVVMPNHMHGLIRLTPDNRVALGQVVNGFKAQVTREVNKAEGKSCVVWQKNYHEVVVHGLKELKAKAAYIRDNPVRWVLKQVPRGTLRAIPAKAGQASGAIPAMAGPPPGGAEAGQWRYAGNIALLEADDITALRVSRRADEKEIAELKERMRETDGTVAGTFLSPGERACLAVLLEEKRRAKVIWVMPMGLPSGIYQEWGAAFGDGRSLWLSAYKDEIREACRERCLECNEWVRRLAMRETLAKARLPLGGDGT